MTWHEGHWETVVESEAWVERVDHPVEFAWVDVWVVRGLISHTYEIAQACADALGVPYSEIQQDKQYLAIGGGWTEYIEHPAVTREVWHEGYWG
jgi:hypothetical protein